MGTDCVGRANSRVAVLVDGDNVSASYAHQILEQANKLGCVDIARVYTDASHTQDWLKILGYRLIHTGTGKNASDLLLAIDAIEMNLALNIETFVIASSDSDFTHLAVRLREHGRYVLGMGESKAPQNFRKACSDFATFKEASETPAKKKPVSNCKDLDKKIVAMIAEHGDSKHGMQIALLGPKMHSIHGTRISTFEERTWRAYLAKRRELFELDPKGSDAMVRLKPKGKLLANGLPDRRNGSGP
ncbi:NYN domain-containing protein [Rhizobiales bacterium]|uniref:NYN domain-containing protein n=1 Tax=Hongsoonwoonella zoysiae TaxID=2821844 RepID=UPI0015614092|nr:NYN domain-containing protein [Hongsoonwoonella zoysiae]NRG16473.1 NYN domain-containing protein [Hongsoonwoonella zoysiae]